jgi:hypothetical protein
MVAYSMRVQCFRRRIFRLCLGIAVPGTSTNKDPEMGNCSWQSTATQVSVSNQIGNPGTARNNACPRQTRRDASNGRRPSGVRCRRQI